MSVIVTVRTNGDPQALERFAGNDAAAMQSIVEAAKSHGVIAHRFYGSDDGQVLVIDEWPDAESFQSFFTESRSQIEPMMAAAGVTSEPVVTVWRELDTNDAVGWEK